MFPRASKARRVWRGLSTAEFETALANMNAVEAVGIKLHLQDLDGDISGIGLSKLFLTIAAAFAEAERDRSRIRERLGRAKADQKARGQYLGGKAPFGFRRGENGELVPHEAGQEAIREMVALRAEGQSLRAIAAALAHVVVLRHRTEPP